MSVSADISSLTKATEPYTAKASIVDGVVDTSTATVTGDRTSGIFANASKELGKDDFLKLLITQLRFQDPLNPMENTEFVAQLAQFRALENSSNIELAIGKLDESFKGTVAAQAYSAQSISNTAAVSLIGKQVRLRQDSVNWTAKAGEKVPIRVHLGNSTDAIVEIVNDDGDVIKTMKATDKDNQNSVELAWDGNTDSGKVAKAGKYTIHIAGQENDSSLYSFVQDEVEGVRFTSDGALIKVDGKELSIGNVLDVSTSGNRSDLLSSVTPSTAVALLGKQVRVRETDIKYGGKQDEVATVNVNTGGSASVRVNILDSKGNTIYYENIPANNNGVALFSWNGETMDGSHAPAGKYKISIQGQDTNPSIYAFSEGRIDGVTNVSGGSQLRIDGKTISISDIIDISEAA